MTQNLAFQILTTFSFPLFAALCSGFSQALIQRQPLKPIHFRVGLELCLAGMCLGYTLLAERLLAPGSMLTQHFSANHSWLLGASLVATFALYLYLLLIYQHDEHALRSEQGDLTWTRILIVDLWGSTPLICILLLILVQ